MDILELGAIGEFAGGVAVIASRIFGGTQSPATTELYGQRASSHGKGA